MPDMKLPSYFYGDEAMQFTYFRIPCQLITHPRFKHLSTDSKLLYGMLLDRMSLSIKNEWYDDTGRVYISKRMLMQPLPCPATILGAGKVSSCCQAWYSPFVPHTKVWPCLPFKRSEYLHSATIYWSGTFGGTGLRGDSAIWLSKRDVCVLATYFSSNSLYQ